MCAFSAKVCVCIGSLLIRSCLVSVRQTDMTLWYGTGLYFHSLSFLNGNASAKGTWVEPGIADAQVCVDSLVILILVRAGSPPTGQCLRDTPDILLFSILNLVDINLEMKLNWECRHSTKLLIFLFSCLYYINNGHVHFIVQRNH